MGWFPSGEIDTNIGPIAVEGRQSSRRVEIYTPTNQNIILEVGDVERFVDLLIQAKQYVCDEPILGFENFRTKVAPEYSERKCNESRENVDGKEA